MDKALLKEKAIEIIKIVAFVLAFFVVLQCISLAGFSEKSATKFNNRKKDAYSFMNDEEQTIQIVGIGNSDVYSGFSPLDLWKEYGHTSTVSASIHQTIQESIDLMKLIYENQSPDLVIIETDMFYDGEDEVGNELKKSNGLSDFFERRNPDNFTHKVEGVYTIFKFHNYWMGGKDNSKKSPYNPHGYKYSNEICKLESVDYMKPTADIDRMSNFNAEQTDALIALCKSKGSEVMILTLPSINTWNMARHNGVEEYAKERNIPFLDLNLCLDEMGIDIRDSFRDEGNHLNYPGAKKVTRFVGEYIDNNYSIEDLRGNKKYQSWDNDLKKFERFLDK